MNFLASNLVSTHSLQILIAGLRTNTSLSLSVCIRLNLVYGNVNWQCTFFYAIYKLPLAAFSGKIENVNIATRQVIAPLYHN